MESESIVDYLKSSLGKPWPLIANTDPEIAQDRLTTNSQTSVPLASTINHNITPTQPNNDLASPQVITNGKDHITGSSPPPSFASVSPPTPSPPTQPNQLPQQTTPSNRSPLTVADNNHLENKANSMNEISNRFNSNHSATQLDGLYPEWDEFYLLVCDICGIIIRPQALEKHLATKHRINVQQQNQNQPLPTNRKTSTTNTSAIKNATTTITNAGNHSSSLGASAPDGSTPRTITNTHGSCNPAARDIRGNTTTVVANKTSTKRPHSPNLPSTTNNSSTTSTSLSNGIKFIADSANNNKRLQSASIQNNSDNASKNRRDVKAPVGFVNNAPNNSHIAKQSNDINFVESTHNGTTTSNAAVATAASTVAQQIPVKLWGGKHALESMPKPAIKRRPCDWMKVRRAPDANPETLSSFLTRASPIVDDTQPPPPTLVTPGLINFDPYELNGNGSCSSLNNTTTAVNQGGKTSKNTKKKGSLTNNSATASTNGVNFNSHNHTNGFFDPTFYGLEPLSPASSLSSSSNITPSSSSSLSSTSSMPPSQPTSLRYQDRKWRNTFNVLKDAFF